MNETLQKRTEEKGNKMFFEAMQTLTQQIISSQQARTASLNSLLEGTRAQLQEFGKAHQAMAQQQRERFSQFRTSRTEADGHRRATTQARMKEFSNDHDKAHDAWHRMEATLHGKQAPSAGTRAEQGTGPEHPSPRPSAKQARHSTAHPG